MNIDCLYNATTGDYACEIPYLEQVSYNGESSYILNYATDGELLIGFFLFLILFFMIFKFAFEFLFPKIIRVKSRL